MGKVGFHVRLEPKLHARMKEMAEGLDISMNELAHAILRDFLYLDDMYVVRIYKRNIGGEVTWEFVGPKEMDDG